MKNSVYALVILLVCSLLYRLPQNESLTPTLAQGSCCPPPLHGPEVPRFPQNTQVNVFIDKGSGFTQSEIDLITEGIADWNNEPNNSGVTYNVQVVETASVPPAGTNNTITVRYRDVVSTGTGGALLNMQRNSNGAIDNGTELFGNAAPQQPTTDLRNGFKALNEYDKASSGGNQDGLIDNKDSVFALLRLWQDTNHDGISSAAELHSLPSLNLASIDLDYKTSKYKDGKGNTFRFRAKVRDSKGAQPGRWVYDVFLDARRAQ